MKAESPSTFPSYLDRCGWNALLAPRTRRPSALGQINAKYAVVGAGFTGLAAARRLHDLDPSADIVVLEATTIGEGSSARNSGFLSPADLPASADAAAVAANDAKNRFFTEGFNELSSLVERHGIDCDLHLSGRIKAAATSGGETSVRQSIDVARALGVDHTSLDRDALRKRIGTAYYRQGVYTGVGHLVQPAALIRGLADALPMPIMLHERSPVVSARRQGKWLLETPDARIEADTVVMATNAAVKSFGYLRDRVVTIFTYAAITAQLSESDRTHLGDMQSWGVLPAHRLGTTVRRVGADRLLVRSLYAYERAISSDAAHAQLRDRFRRRYPDLAHVDLEFVWGGTTALTMNGAPFFGRLDDGLYAFAGCNGSGIVKGTALGRHIADVIVGKHNSDTIDTTFSGPSWIAPEPFRKLGFKVISAIERRKAGLES